VEDLGALGEVAAVGDVDGGQGGGVEPLVLAVAAALHQAPPQVHVHQAVVGLRDAVLQTGRNAQFPGFHRQDEVGEFWQGDPDSVKAAQCAKARGDDGAGACQADRPGDVGGVFEREAAVREAQAGRRRVIVKSLDGGLQEAQAAVIAVQPYISHERLEVGKHREVAVGRKNLDARRLVQGDLRTKVEKGERDRAAEIAVRRVADQSGTRMGMGANQHRPGP